MNERRLSKQEKLMSQHCVTWNFRKITHKNGAFIVKFVWCNFITSIYKGRLLILLWLRLGLFGLLTLTPHSVQMGRMGKNHYLQVFKSKNNPVSTNGSPKGVIQGSARMREDGPKIARRTDRVGVLPHAPLVGNRPEFALSRVNLFHLWAHCASVP